MSRWGRISRVLGLGLTVLMMAVPGGSIEPPFEVEEVAEGVYSVRRKFVGSNAALILTDREVIVVDTHASPAGARGTLAALREITDLPVRYVVNTHWHTDHFVGNRAYLDAFPEGVDILSHETVPEDILRLAPEQLPIAVRYIREDLEAAARMLMSGRDEHERPLTELQKRRLARFADDQGRTVGELTPEAFVLPNLTLSKGVTLRRGEQEIRILFLGRGHTRGDLVVHLPRERTVVAGDLLTHPTLHVGGSSRPVEWLASLEALHDLDFDRVIPGHGPVIHGREYLELVISLLEEVVDQVRAGIDEGKKFAEIESGISLEDSYAQWVGDDRERATVFEKAKGFVPDAVGRAYLELTGRLDEPGD